MNMLRLQLLRERHRSIIGVLNLHSTIEDLLPSQGFVSALCSFISSISTEISIVSLLQGPLQHCESGSELISGAS